MSVQAIQPLVFRQGDVILEEGSTGDAAFIILKGEVEVYKADKRGRRTLVGRLGPNELIGELCLFGKHSVRSASVVAFTDRVEVMKLPKTDFELELTKMSPRMRHLMSALIQRLEQTYTRIAFLS